MKKILNIPNILTISRVFLIPGMVTCFFLKIPCGNLISLFIFIFCSISDFLDGYLARTFKQTTKLGQILDPLADKLLISTTLILIVGFDLVSKSAIIPASIILCREIMVSEIRESAFQNGKNFKTELVAKWKTATQMTSICVILSATFFSHKNVITILGEIILWISSLLAMLSAMLYFLRHKFIQ